MTTADYLTSLQNDLSTIKQHLSNGGMEISENDNFSNIATKTDGIQIGGGASFNITDGSYLFYNNARISNEDNLLPLIKNCISCYRMYYSSTLVRDAKLFDTSGCTDFRQMFNSCNNLKSVPSYDLSSAVNLNSMFAYCNQLKSVPNYDLSSATDLGGMFYNCNGLETIGNYSIPNATNMNNMFKYTYNLTNESLNNILAMCTTATSMTTKTLSNLGLTGAQISTCQTLSNYDDFVAAGWSAS